MRVDDKSHARKIYWLRGMLRWAVRLAREWRETARENKNYWKAISGKEHWNGFVNQIENTRLRAENDALREAGRKLVMARDKADGALHEAALAWREIDPDA